MKKFIIFILIILAFVFSTVRNNCIIELKSGESIKGILIEENEDTVTLKSETLGTMTIERSKIKEIVQNVSSSGYKYNDPNHNSLLFMPSAETNPKGTKYFSSYELVYLNLGASPTDNLNVAIGFVFPFTPDVIVHTPLSIGFKYRFLHEPHRLNVSLMSSYSTILESENSSLFTIDGAFNYYFNPTTTIDFYLGNIINPNDTDYTIIHYGIALTKRVSPNSKFIIEYMNGMWENYTMDGVLMFGVRFFGKKISGDIAAIKFMDFSDNNDNLWFLLPLVSLTYHF
ncbi:MAG: hypothetical protein GQ534_03020 [Candidatus Delongbacteria bacterium]|nr:hypothetical protein [Candidatus Delongbacteria bacterium]